MNRNPVALVLLLGLSCGPPAVSSDEAARRAYLGLDRSLGKALTIGFQGFNQASSANISPQQTTGDDGGTMTITGQVDQGASANKGMRLRVELVGYTDGVVQLDGGASFKLVYGTDAGLPALDVQLKGIPSGTYSGTLKGSYGMSGDLSGNVTLDVSFAGQLESDGSGGTRRKPGTTTVTGSAQASGGTYQVNASL